MLCFIKDKATKYKRSLAFNGVITAFVKIFMDSCRELFK